MQNSRDRWLARGRCQLARGLDQGDFTLATYLVDEKAITARNHSVGWHDAITRRRGPVRDMSAGQTL